MSVSELTSFNKLDSNSFQIANNFFEQGGGSNGEWVLTIGGVSINMLIIMLLLQLVLLSFLWGQLLRVWRGK